VSEKGTIRWWRGSENFDERFWIEAGTPVSPNTVAGSILQGESAPISPIEVATDEWAQCKTGYEHDVLIEEVFQLDVRVRR
jgi:hypothetical protein